MSRKKLFARSVFIGYIALVSQVAYSFASIPLALSYLSHAEFGMFSLISSLVSYLGLAELGMTNGFQRHLFECKDGTDPARYGRYFTAALIALGLVSLAILVLGVAGTYLTAPLFHIQDNLLASYHWTMLGMVGVCAASVATRFLGSPLYIHQRHDLIQLSQIGQFAILYFVLHYGLISGWGVYSLLANSIAAFLWSLTFNVIACLRLGLYPKRANWALPHKQEWNSVLGYSRDVFILQLGSKLAGGMPMLLLPRLLGLEAVAAWTICSRPFAILKQLVTKPYEYALPMLCEIYVRNEPQRMAKRWVQLTQLIVTVSVCIFAVAAANNPHFIRLWTGERMSWDPINHWLLALMFLAGIISSSAFEVIGFNKRIGNNRFIPLFEATLMLVNGLWMTRLWGVAGLLLAAVIAPLAGNAIFGILHIAEISGMRMRELFHQSLLRPLLILPLVVLTAWGTSLLYQVSPGYPGLLLAAATGSLLAGILGFFLGFSSDVRKEFLQMLLKPLGRVSRFGKLKAES